MERRCALMVLVRARSKPVTCAALGCGDDVDVGLDVGVVGAVPAECDVDCHGAFDVGADERLGFLVEYGDGFGVGAFTGDGDGVVDGFAGGEVVDEVGGAAFEAEGLFDGSVFSAFVGEVDGETWDEEGGLAGAG